VINEVESNGGTPNDWVELTNVGSTTVDISGWILRDNDDADAFVIPTGTTVAPGAFVVLDTFALSTTTGNFGLGASDNARLFMPDGTTLVDSEMWTAHAAGTRSRCPDGTGPFSDRASTKGAANSCQ